MLTAAPCPRGPQDLVLGAEMVALQIHESCGHPIELDRVLGSEATFAGTSFHPRPARLVPVLGHRP